MTVVVLLLAGLSAFEFSPSTGASAAMLTGVADGGFAASLNLNPALVLTDARFSSCASYCRPYGLEGLDWGQVGAGVSRGGWAVGAGVTSLGLARYRESDFRLAAGFGLPMGIAAGAAAHWMMTEAGQHGTDGAPAVDLGIAWRSGMISLGAAGLRLNAPRFANGDEPGVAWVAGAAARPVEAFEVAADVRRDRSGRTVSLGMQFRMFPVLALRVGGAYEPLQYGAGVGVRVGPLTVDYAWRFHPLLKETHLLGLQAAWR